MEQKTTTKTDVRELYDQDYVLWVERTVADLQAGNLQDLDLENLIDEVGDIARHQKRMLCRNLVAILKRLLQYISQPEERFNTLRAKLLEHRYQVEDAIEDSPSLESYAIANLEECYVDALEQAADETGLPRSAFPPENPFTIDQVFDAEYLPE